MAKYKVLVIDNDSHHCQMLHSAMESDSISITNTTNCYDALESYMFQRYHLVIMDIQLNEANGLWMLRTLLQMRPVPVMIISAPLAGEELVPLYQAGATAYIEKPVNMEICAAQARALMELFDMAVLKEERPYVLTFGPRLSIIPLWHQVRIDGQILKFTKQEFQVLYYLARNRHRVLSLDEIYQEVWGTPSGHSNDEAVRSYIKILRKKLSGIDGMGIRNVYGIGYQFFYNK